MTLRIVEKEGFVFGKIWSIEVLVKSGFFSKKSEWKNATYIKGLRVFPEYYTSLECAEQEIENIKRKLKPLVTKVVKEYEL